MSLFVCCQNVNCIACLCMVLYKIKMILHLSSFVDNKIFIVHVQWDGVYIFQIESLNNFSTLIFFICFFFLRWKSIIVGGWLVYMMNKSTSRLLVWILIATHTCGRKCQSIRDFSECSQEWVTNRESREKLQLNPSEWVIVLYIVIGTSIQASTFCQLAMATKTWKVPCMSEVWSLSQQAMSKSK